MAARPAAARPDVLAVGSATAPRSRVGPAALQFRPSSSPVTAHDDEEDLQMVSTLKPMSDRVVVKPKDREKETKSCIVLPDTATERPQQGAVLSVGPGRVLDNGKRADVDLKVGDTVLFAKYSG